MAQWILFSRKLWTAAGCIGLMSALVGCQQYTQSVQALPSPNFAPPQVAQATAPPPLVLIPPLPAPVLPMPVEPKLPLPPRAIASAIPRNWMPPVAPRAWRWIVVHHSATTTGGAAAFDKMHRAKGWDMLGYDFVIGNGTDTRDGQIEVGPRWTRQLIGAHAKTPDNRYNEYGIGICLVGNFDVERPTPAQLKSLTKLVAYLMKTYRIPSDCIIGHRDTKSTDCPGRYMYADLSLIRRKAAALAGGGALAASDERSPDTELLTAK